MIKIIFCTALLLSICGTIIFNRQMPSLGDSNHSSPVDQLALQSIYNRLEKVKSKCGQICVTEESKTEVIGKGWYDIVRKPFSCENMFKYDFFDAYSEFENSPQRIPAFLYEEFSYQGRINITYRYRNEKPTASKPKVWTKVRVDNLINMTRHGIPISIYGVEAYSSLKMGIDQAQIDGSHVLVIGSQRPWLEAMLLEQGAAHVTTLDYSTINCDHPQITTCTPPEFTAAFLDGTLPVFDGVASYSSLEHSGLGRYGDGLNPYGDLIAMARSWCLIKDLGFAIVGVPTGPDQITFNLHRIYGPLMYSHLFANWQQIWTDTDINVFSSEKHQGSTFWGRYVGTVHVLRKDKTFFHL